MGIGETFTFEYARIDDKERKLFISTAVLYPLFILLLVLLIVLIFHNFFTTYTNLSSALLYTICFLSFFNFFSDFLFSIFRNKDKPYQYALFAFCKTVIELILAIYFIKYCKLGYEGRVSSIFIASFVSFLFVVIYLLKNKLIRFEFSQKWFNTILRKGLPTIPLFFMFFILSNTDKYMINYYYGSAKAGVYGLATQFSMLLTLITSSFITPFYPFLYENLYLKKHKKIILVVLIFSILLLIFTILVPLILPYLFEIFIDTKFNEALDYVFFLMLGQFFFGLYLLQGGLIYYRNKNYIYYYVAPLVISLSIISNYYVLNVFKIQQLALGAFLSYLACFIIMSLFCYKDMIKCLKLIYNLRKQINI